MELDLKRVVSDFVAAFAAVDTDAMAVLLNERVVACITNAEGGADVIEGRNALLERIGAVNYGGAELSIELTNAIEPASGQVLAMAKIHAIAPSGEELHNFAAHLCTVSDGLITEWWMVEALPAESDRFWAAMTSV